MIDKLKYKRAIAIIALLLFCLSSMYASLSTDDVNNLKDKLEAAILAVSASYTNIPKIQLNGVEYEEGAGVLPKNIYFKDSDLASYYSSLSSPKRSGLLGLISKLSSSASPIMKKALEKLNALNLKPNDFIIDGNVRILGGDTLSLTDLMLGNNLSSISIDAIGELELYGTSIGKTYKIKFKLKCKGIDNRKIEFDINECNIDETSIFISPIIVSFEKL